jgi:flagellar protein FliT
MAPAKALILHYQHVFSLSEQMRALATTEKWDELINMEINYIRAVESTLQHNMPLLTTSQQDILSKTVRAIIENEHEIKQLLQLRMGVISRQLMNQARRQQAVNAAYGQHSPWPLLSGDSQ